MEGTSIQTLNVFCFYACVLFAELVFIVPSCFSHAYPPELVCRPHYSTLMHMYIFMILYIYIKFRDQK